MHDSGYAFGGFWITGKFTRYDRKDIDDLLYEMVISEGAWKSTAWAIWLAVRMFGGWYWKKGDMKDFQSETQRDTTVQTMKEK
jgi:hypothetical protein